MRMRIALTEDHPPSYLSQGIQDDLMVGFLTFLGWCRKAHTEGLVHHVAQPLFDAAWGKSEQLLGGAVLGDRFVELCLPVLVGLHHR